MISKINRTIFVGILCTTTFWWQT